MMRVCFFGTYRAAYTRHQNLLIRLKTVGIEVLECHQEFWIDDADRTNAASGEWRHPRFLWRLLRTYFRLVWEYLFKIGDHEVMIIGYPGQLDVFIGRMLSWLRRKPLVWDILMSIYLIAKERQLDQKSAATITGMRWIEGIACRLPDRLILDSNAYVEWFTSEYKIPRAKFRLLPIGADDRIFHPPEKKERQNNESVVLFYGTFHPNSGTAMIIEAAKLLKDNLDIRFQMVGGGPDWEVAQKLIREYDLSNIEIVEWMGKEQLIKKIGQADICLGSFGATPQGLMTVHNKIYECMAMAMPVITGDSPAVRENFEHEKQIYLVEREKPPALAEAILRLLGDEEMRESLSENGYNFFQERFTNARLGACLKEILFESVQG